MSGTLPSWLERLLGIEAGPGEGTAWSLDYLWPWAPWLTLLLVACAVAFVVAVYLREGRQATRRYRMMLAAIRLGLVAMLLAMIAQVSLSLKRTGLPYVAVIVDDSLSMTTVDRYEDKLRALLADRVRRADPGPSADSSDADLSRWNLAKTLLSERSGALLGSITEGYKLRVYFLTGPRSSHGTSVEEITEEIRALRPTGETTRLGAAVRTVLDDLRGSAPAAFVLVTDGINTDGPPLADAAALARRKGVPLLIVGLGSDQPVRDLQLSDLLVDDVVFLNDVVDFEVRLTGTGFQGNKVAVVLRAEGSPSALAKVEVTVGPDGQSQQVRVPYRPTKIGRFKYVVEVEPQEGELKTDNNRQERIVEVRKDKIRVLLAQAYPSYEYRYLRDMLARDETIELRTVLQEADVEHAQQDASALRVFPVRREELFAYDVIILGDLNPALLSASVVQNIVDFVDQPGKGGALVLISGPMYMPAAFRNTPLARLMPMELGSIRYTDPDRPITDEFLVQPTELGLASPPMQLGDTADQTRTIWQRLAPLYWLLEVPELKPGARVLAEHSSRRTPDGRPLPVIWVQYVGAGKVLMHATDETWRWRGRVGEVFFARYWVQMIRYLSRSKLADRGRAAELSADRREYGQGEPVRLRVRFADERLAPQSDDGVTVVLEQQGHKTRRVGLRRIAAGRGIFEGVLSGLPAGSYHAWIATPAMEGKAPAVDFTVRPPAGEFERIRPDTAELRRIAEQTNGHFYTFTTASRLIDDLPAGQQVPIESLPPKPLWNTWPLLALFLLLLSGEWILRKVRGMV